MRSSTHILIRSSLHRYSCYSAKQRISFRSVGFSRPNSPHRQFKPDITSHFRATVHSSYSPYIFVFAIVCGGAVIYDYFNRSSEFTEVEAAAPPEVEEFTFVYDERHPDYSNMPVPEGFIGNLTPEHEAKLRELWISTFKAFGVPDPSRPNGAPAEPVSAIPAHVQPETPEKKKKRSSLFSRNKHEDDGASSAGEDDKWGQTAELQQLLKTQSPESLRSTYWDMTKADHPDALLLRFLRARKWDVEKAFAMMISTMNWRRTQMRVDDDIMIQGEEGALKDSQSSDSAVKREGHDFLAQMRMGKSFLHGTDSEGRPITWVRARLHKSGEQTEKSMERYTVFVIETARLTLRPPVETACIVFDMTNFTLANMDYTPVKFMIKVFEANYPESLGAVLIHKSPWLFQGIWKVIKGWLDPVVASKIHFTNSVDDMQSYIPKNQIIKELGGDEDWDYQYVECTENENDAMKDTETRKVLQEERKASVLKFQDTTFKWINAAGSSNSSETETAKSERDTIAKTLRDNYWKLDPYIRARSLYDRVGMIDKTGNINFYAKHTLKAENVNGKVAGESAPQPQSTGISADDDVD